VTEQHQHRARNPGPLPGVYSYHVGAGDVGQRLDHFLHGQEPLAVWTRSQVQSIIRAGQVLVNGLSCKTGYRLHVGDHIEARVPVPVPSSYLPAADVVFTILYEDDSLAVLSKPAGLVVHPAAGHQQHTLVHGLLYRLEHLSGISGEERPGVVHRLDKDTSGIMVVAKNDSAHRFLIDQFRQRQVKKTYLAILDGTPRTTEGRIELPIGRHPVQRKKMAVVPDIGRPAVTTWRILEKLPYNFSLVAVGLETGRTHQIRVHMAAKGHPVAGDPVYGRKNARYGNLGIVRQCLHAFRLAFRHPVSQELVVFEAPLYADMAEVLARLRAVVMRSGDGLGERPHGEAGCRDKCNG